MTLFFNLLFFLFLSHQSIAGDRGVGNGGDAIKCSGQIELLDYYEGREVLGLKKYHFGDGENELEIAHNLIQKIDRDLLRYSVYTDWLSTFMDEVQFVQTELEDISDYGHVFIPSSCKLIQVAIQRHSSSLKKDEKRYIIHKPTWDVMDIHHKAGLILHEIIYREAIESGFQNSKATRRANAILASKKFNHSSLFQLVKNIEEENISKLSSHYFSYNLNQDSIYLGEALNFYPLNKKNTYSNINHVLSNSKSIFEILSILKTPTEISSSTIVNCYWTLFDRTPCLYRHDIDQDVLKKRLTKEKEPIFIGILSSRLEGLEDFKVQLIQKIAHSNETDLNKSIAASMVLSSIRESVSLSPITLAKLMELLLTKFKLLMINHEYFPFFTKPFPFNSAHNKVTSLNLIINHLQAEKINENPLYKETLKKAFSNIILKTKDKLIFTNTVNLLAKVNYIQTIQNERSYGVESNQEKVFKTIDLSSSIYEMIYNKKHLYINRKIAYGDSPFWRLMGSGYSAFINSWPTKIAECYIDRTSQMTSGLLWIDEISCERMQVLDNKNAQDIILPIKTLKTLIRKLRSYARVTYSKEILELLLYNSSQSVEIRKELNYTLINFLINGPNKTSWDSRLTEYFSNFLDLDQSLLEAIFFIFDEQEERIQLEILDKIISKQIKNKDIIYKWLKENSQIQYSIAVNEKITFLLKQMTTN